MIADDLLPTNLLHHAAPTDTVENWRGVQIDDDRLAMVLRRDAVLLKLHEGTCHGEGSVWQSARERLVCELWPELGDGVVRRAAYRGG